MALPTFSLPWDYLLAMSEFISIFTSGSQPTSSVHSQTRLLPSLLSSAAVTFTTRSRSGNSKRCGVSGAVVAGRRDVHDEVEVGELEALRRVGVAQLRSHVGIGAHHLEHSIHD